MLHSQLLGTLPELPTLLADPVAPVPEPTARLDAFEGYADGGRDNRRELTRSLFCLALALPLVAPLDERVPAGSAGGKRRCMSVGKGWGRVGWGVCVWGGGGIPARDLGRGLKLLHILPQLLSTDVCRRQTFVPGRTLSSRQAQRSPVRIELGHNGGARVAHQRFVQRLGAQRQLKGALVPAGAA